MSQQEKWTPEQGKLFFSQKKTENRLKYKNEPTVVDGIRFDSIKEADYYGQLKLRKRAGLLADFQVHPIFELRVNGVLICTYEADFSLTFPDGSKRVVDVKSVATEGLPVFRMKKALMFAIHGIIVYIEK